MMGPIFSTRPSFAALAAVVLLFLVSTTAFADESLSTAGLSTTDTDQVQLVPAAERAPNFVQADAGIAIRPGLASSWETVPFDMDVHASFGRWRSRSLALFAGVGVVSGASVEVERFRDVGTVSERFRLAPLRAGIKWNLRSRPDWVEFNVIAAGSVAVGSREYLNDRRILHRERVLSFGGGGGLEWAVTKFKRTGASIKAQYFLQPATLDEHTGFLTHGFTELGGLEITLGVTYFLGGPR